MSHFSVLVIGENVSEQLEPFWELDLSPEEMKQDSRAEFQEEFKVEDLEKEFEKFKKELPKHKDEYSNAKEWVVGWSGIYLNKEETAYGYYTNPNGHWDWFEIGGRWSGIIKLKHEGERDEKILKELGDEERKTCNSALKKDIVNLHELKTYALLHNGEWLSRGKMGWFGMSDDKISEEEWDRRLLDYLNKLPDNTKITLVDCHI